MPTIVLTRPAGENESLADLLRTKCDDVRIHPLVELLPLEVTPAMRKVAQDLDLVDRVVFVSKSAVRFTLPLFDSFWPQWPAALSWFAVGEGTAAELGAFNVDAEFPEQAGSEGLLALPGLQRVSGRRVMIVRGRGGRALLGDELSRRGAEVVYFETYERRALVDEELAQVPGGTVVVVTSVEILEAARQALGNRFPGCAIITASERIADAARELGPATVLNAGGASDQALYDAFIQLL